MKRKKGFFSISAVSKMFSVHPQTVRLYEKEGFLNPKRSEGNTRMFTEEDIDRLEEIIHLTHELGINMAGVEMILKLKKQISKLQSDMNKAFKATQVELTKQEERSKSVAKKQVDRLASMRQDGKNKQGAKPAAHVAENLNEDQGQLDISSWEIEYDN